VVIAIIVIIKALSTSVEKTLCGDRVDLRSGLSSGKADRARVGSKSQFVIVIINPVR